jgi:two-component system, OmpR family, response regulator ChvI
MNPKILIMANNRRISTDKDKSPVYRILVVDDDHDITLSFKAGLEENGSFLVYTFNDSQQALAEFKANFYDLLLLDIRMLKMNGFELHRELKKIDAKPKACFVTAYETYYEELKKDFPTLAVSRFIKKPIQIDDLIRCIIEELES